MQEGGGRTPNPPSSLYGTLLCRRGRVNKNINRKVAGSARHPGRSTFYAVLPAGVKGQPPGLTAPPSSFQPPQPPSLKLHSFLFFRAGDVAPSSLLRCHWPAAPPVSSVPRGYCRDVTFSWQHHWASPPSPMGSVTGLQRWGVGGWATAGRWDGIKPSLPGLPLSTPQQRSMTED